MSYLLLSSTYVAFLRAFGGETKEQKRRVPTRSVRVKS